MVDAVVVLQVEGNGSAMIRTHRHGSRADLLEGAERAFLHPEPALVLQEHHTVAMGEGTRAALHDDTDLLAEFAGLPHPSAGSLVEGAHLVIGVGEDDAATVWRGLPVTVPAVDQLAARLFPRLSGMYHAASIIGLDRIVDPAGRQIARGITLPVRALAPHLADLGAAVTLNERAEGGARLDRLQLLRIADQHHFGARIRSMGEHALQLARADHAGLIHHQNIA